MREITFNELPRFTKQVDDVLGGDDELMKLQIYLAENPTKGDVIPKSQGLRKLRWQIPGRSKAAGARVIYYRWEEFQTLFASFIQKRRKLISRVRKSKISERLLNEECENHPQKLHYEKNYDQ